MGRALLLAALLWAVCAPSWAASKCKLGKLAELKPIIEQSRIYVPGKVNGKQVLFMVDSGADTLLFASEAAAAGIAVGGYSGDSFGATGHETADSRATVSSLEIGLWNGHDVTLRAVGTLGNEHVGDMPVIGVLGEDILSHFDVEIDVKGGFFALYQVTDCEDANLAFWTDTYNVVGMSRYDTRQPRILLNGKLNESTVAMLLDTGAPYSAVSLDVARALGLKPGEPGAEAVGQSSGVHGQAEATWIGSFSSFTLDQERIAPAKIRFFKFAQTGPETGSRLGRRALDIDMFLGFDFIRAHHILISHSQRKLYFSYAGGQPFSVPAKDK
jgi:hypothetical protein